MIGKSGWGRIPRKPVVMFLPVLAGAWALSVVLMAPEGDDAVETTWAAAPRAVRTTTQSAGVLPAAGAPAATSTGGYAPVSAPARAGSPTIAAAAAIVRDARWDQVEDASVPLAQRRAIFQGLAGQLLNEAGPTLERLIGESEDEVLVADALRVLARAARAGALEAPLAQRLASLALERSESAPVALAAGATFEAIGGDALNVHALKALMGRCELPSARVTTLRALALIPGPRRTAMLQQALLRDPSPLVRGEALELAVRLDARRGLSLIVGALRDPLIKARAGQLLARQRGRAAEFALMRAFQDADDRELRQVLAQALVGRSPTPLLERVALSNTIRAEPIADALALAANPARLNVLEKVFAEGAHEGARAAALRGLARATRVTSQQLQHLAASDPSPLVRTAAQDLLEGERVAKLGEAVPGVRQG